MPQDFAKAPVKPVPFRTEKTVCFHRDIANFGHANALESKALTQPAIRGAGL